MDAERKEVIIHEIKYWKDSHLLPDQYCDYLLALYTEGASVDDELASNQSQNNGFIISFLLLNLLLAPSVAFIIFNTKISFISSVFLLIVTAIACLGISYIGSKIFLIDSHYISLALLLNMLIISLIIVNQWVTQPFIGLIVVFSQLVLWIGLGIKFSNKWLIIMGGLGLIISLIMLAI